MARRRGLVHCRECNSSNVRLARLSGLRERLLHVFGFYAFRCENCCERFIARPLGVGSVAFAKCPKCYRMDLSIWDPKYYRSPAWMDLKVWLGGNRWRCEACRCNFVSWRPRKDKYARPEPESPPPQAPDYHELHDT